MIKGFIFDFDGVIIDTNKYHFDSWKESLNLFNIDFDEKKYNEIKGLSRRKSLDFLTSEQNQLSEEKKEELLKQKNDIFLDLIKDLKSDDLLPGVQDFIFHFKNSHKLGVASSSKNAKYILKKINFDHFFDVILDGTMLLESKPDPEVFLKCADLLNLRPEQCVVFEDSKNGILGAKKGGFFTYLIGGDIECKNLADKFLKDLTYYK